MRVRANYKASDLYGAGGTNALTYYTPNAFEGYHLTVSASAGIAVELDEFVFDMRL